MTESPGAEPSLDEILASIRRIISEEGPATAAASALPSMRLVDTAGADEVLVLTRRAPVEVHAMTGSDDRAESVAQDDVVSVAPDPAQAPALEAPVAEAPAVAGASAQEDTVVAPQTEARTAAAFDKLSAAAHAHEPSPSLLMPAAGRTLEDVVRELMRPLIKEWLDENLPALVQARVDQEIDRIARQRVR